MKRKLLLFLCLFAVGEQLPAQEKAPVKFGRVSPTDFKSAYAIDSGASAVIIADVGITGIVGNSKGGFSLEFQCYRRAHILNKNGYDIGDVSIILYTNGEAEEDLIHLKAVTYNLENGKVIETRLESKTGLFKDRLDKNHVSRKFTFPNIKEGSIIEYQYTIKSDFIFNLQPWEFQGEYPRLWSEYTAAIPEFYYYVTLTQGYHPFYIKDQKGRSMNFVRSDSRTAGATERESFSAGVTDYRWVMKNVPALKEEGYTSTINNHLAKIEFQLAEIRHPFMPQNVMGTWTQTTDQLLKSEDFGFALDRDNGWLNEAMPLALRGATTSLEKAKNIFAYVRDNLTCTNYNRTMLDQPLRNVLRNRNGSEAEINLLLIAMLRKADLEADPVMLSTRSHGYTYELYPLLDRFNYVIAQLNIGHQTWYLDASEPNMGFGKLGYKCYNGHARVINRDATPVEFTPDSLVERKMTSFFVITDNNGHWSGTAQRAPGFYESCRLRTKMKEGGREEFLADLKRSFSSETEISDLVVDSLDKLEEPLLVKYNFETKQQEDNIIYINPMFGEGYRENPFRSARRFYPVEMPYTLDETYLLQMQIPDGYVVDELPRQIMVKLNENDDGLFEYRLSESNGTISLRSRLRIKRSFFLPEEYSMLREFFDLVVRKHNEHIVLKKKS